MSRPKGSGSRSSRKKDQIKEIDPDHIEGVGGSPSGTCVVSASPSGRGYRDTPPGAYHMLAANPQWTVREAADELGVSVGTVSNWRRRIKRGDPPKPGGRPKTAPDEDRDRADFERRIWLARNDPRAGLVRLIRRLVRRPRRLSTDDLLNLRVSLYQTTYTVYVDRHGKHVPVSTNGDAIVREALGARRAKAFLKILWSNFQHPKKSRSRHEESFCIEDFQTEIPARAKATCEWED